MTGLSFIDGYLDAIATVSARLDQDAIQDMASELASCRQRHGRVFCLGVGGSSANASHLVNDLRKICGIEAYAPTDNVAELTARTNDDDWQSVFVEWLRGSRLGNYDAIFVLSVGGGGENVSKNIALACRYARSVGARILGIVGRDGGVTLELGHAVCLIPPIAALVTPITESFQAVVWHCLVNHPMLVRT